MTSQDPIFIAVADIDNNTGQIPDVKPNPREIDTEGFDLLKTQITEYPELLEHRGLLVYPFEGRYVTIGGNQRLRALKDLGIEEAPCFIIPEDTDAETLNAIQILDNVPFGKWDFTKLKEWDTEQLRGFNITVPVPESSLNLGEFFNEGDDETKTKIVIILPENLRPLKDEIKETIKTELNSNAYQGCKVK